MKPIGVSTQLFAEKLLAEDHFRMIGESGFRVLEVFAAPGHFEWQDEAYVARMAWVIRELGLRVFSVHAPWAPGQDIAALDEKQRQASLAAVRKAVDALLAMDGHVLVLHPGATLSDRSKKEEQLHIAKDSIAAVAEYCATHKVRVALENPPPYELGGDNADMLALYRRFADDSTVQACFDTGHAHIAAEGVTFVEQIPKEVLLVHLSDNSGGSDDHLPPSRGTIVWEALFASLRRRHFAGCLMLELTDMPDAAKVLTAGWTWMNHALESI